MRVAAATATFAAAALMLGAAGSASAQSYQARVYTAPPTPPATAYGQASWGQPYGSGSGYVYGRGGVSGGEASGRVYAATGRASTGYSYYGYGYEGGPSYDYGYGYGYDYGHGGHDSHDRGGGHGCGRSACAPPPPRHDCYSSCGGYGRDRGGRYGYSEGGRYYYGSSGGYSSRSSYRDEWGYNDDRSRTARGYDRDDRYSRRDRDCGCAYPLDDR